MEYFAIAAALFALAAMILAGLAWRAAVQGGAGVQLTAAFRSSVEPLFAQHKELLERAIRNEAALAR